MNFIYNTIMYFIDNFKFNIVTIDPINVYNNIFNITLFSEYYYFFFFFFLFTFSIFLHLNKSKNYPNVYKLITCNIIIVLVNTILIDLFNSINLLQSYDLFKSSGDILLKNIILLISIMFFIYTYNYMKQIKNQVFEFLIIIFFTIMNILFFIISIDIISFYLLLEIISLCYYVLTAFNKYNQYSVESGLKYFILSSFTSICLLFGYSFLYGLTGTLNISDISIFVSLQQENIIFFYIICSLFIFIAFFFKLYIAPFHFWISDIYQGALSSTTAFFATLTSIPLFYIFNKYLIFSFHFINVYIFPFFLLLSTLSMLLGTLGALYQKKIKRLIAYSSVSTIGYILIGIIQENVNMLYSTYTYFILYTINTMGILIIFLNLFDKYNNFFIEKVSLLSGFIEKNKTLSICLIILFFSSAGIPPFSLFLAKLVILTNISYQYNIIILFIFIISTILSCFYYLKIIKIMCFDKLNKSIYLQKINYINSIFIINIVLLNIFYFINPSLINVITEYITLSLYI